MQLDDAWVPYGIDHNVELEPDNLEGKILNLCIEHVLNACGQQIQSCHR